MIHSSFNLSFKLKFKLLSFFFHDLSLKERERGWRSVFRTPVRKTHSGVPVYAQGTRVPARGGPERPSSRREEGGEQRKDAKKTKDRRQPEG